MQSNRRRGTAPLRDCPPRSTGCVFPQHSKSRNPSDTVCQNRVCGTFPRRSTAWLPPAPPPPTPQQPRSQLPARRRTTAFAAATPGSAPATKTTTRNSTTSTLRRRCGRVGRLSRLRWRVVPRPKVTCADLPRFAAVVFRQDPGGRPSGGLWRSEMDVWGRRESNPRPASYKDAALTA